MPDFIKKGAKFSKIGQKTSKKVKNGLTCQTPTMALAIKMSRITKGSTNGRFYKRGPNFRKFDRDLQKWSYLPDTDNGIGDQNEQNNKGFNKCGNRSVVVFKER